MSADNGIYVGCFLSNEYRVTHAQAIENIGDQGEFIPCYVVQYFKNAKVFNTQIEALTYAHELTKEYYILEYGVNCIYFNHTFQEFLNFVERGDYGRNSLDAD